MAKHNLQQPHNHHKIPKPKHPQPTLAQAKAKGTHITSIQKPANKTFTHLRLKSFLATTSPQPTIKIGGSSIDPT
jgi:hypothetical protein